MKALDRATRASAGQGRNQSMVGQETIPKEKEGWEGRNGGGRDI